MEYTCDYLVVGAGAVGMAFVDTLLEESDASILIVDARHQPGGHWNDAYPFVRLHQPSHFYGVASTPLGSDRIDETGFNKGFYELAGGAEVQSYFERVMRERFLPSGRVQYLPMCRFEADGTLHHLLSGEKSTVTINKRRVDCTFFETSIPSRHKPKFEIGEGVACQPPNALPVIAPEFSSYCVLGAGKTAMDALIWLLDHGAAPADITWVSPRQSWMINREVTQASATFFKESIGGFANQLQACAEATSPADLFDRLEACGFMVRVNEHERPQMFHFATISRGEVERLRQLTNLIEGSRVAAIEATAMNLSSGETCAMPQDTLYVDCTASAVDFSRTDTRPVFEEGLITIQPVRMPNPCLSAAVTAYLECHYQDDEERNRLAQPVLLPDDEVGYVRATLGNMMNQLTWTAERGLSQFVRDCRLDGFGAVVAAVDTDDPEQVAIVEKMQRYAEPAGLNLFKLLSEA